MPISQYRLNEKIKSLLKSNPLNSKPKRKSKYLKTISGSINWSMPKNDISNINGITLQTKKGSLFLKKKDSKAIIKKTPATFLISMKKNKGLELKNSFLKVKKRSQRTKIINGKTALIVFPVVLFIFLFFSTNHLHIIINV
jgi:hypothetical protein